MLRTRLCMIKNVELLSQICQLCFAFLYRDSWAWTAFKYFFKFIFGVRPFCGSFIHLNLVHVPSHVLDLKQCSANCYIAAWVKNLRSRPRGPDLYLPTLLNLYLKCSILTCVMIFFVLLDLWTIEEFVLFQWSGIADLELPIPPNRDASYCPPMKVPLCWLVVMTTPPVPWIHWLSKIIHIF